MPYTQVTETGWNYTETLISALRTLLLSDGWTEVEYTDPGDMGFVLKMYKGDTAFHFYGSGLYILMMYVGTHFSGTVLQNTHTEYCQSHSSNTLIRDFYLCCFDEDIFIIGYDSLSSYILFMGVSNINKFGSYSGGLCGFTGASLSTNNIIDSIGTYLRSCVLMGGTYGDVGITPYKWFQGTSFTTSSNPALANRVSFAGLSPSNFTAVFKVPEYSLVSIFMPIYLKVCDAVDNANYHLVGAFKYLYSANTHNLNYSVGDVIDHNGGQWLILQDGYTVNSGPNLVFRVA